MILVIPILVCLIISIVLGWVWYGPFFGKKWMDITGANQNDPARSAEMKKKMWVYILTQVVISLVTLIAFSLFLAGFQSVTLFAAIIIATFLWLGFVLPTIAQHALWSGKSRKSSWAMFLISGGYYLIAFVLYGVVFSFWL